ncbi:double-strand break repair helicase AddA [Sphingomicrobium lutaoense]|uniref:DNA 3'-5' helicase n=1 Tax=Sphingomicrobium lutaoense TaxID=515949 RepID=A0A839YZE7_9SPHN|nr:double-strand break repair helicase AddA [Sphingomicrobium lutaoense]MBB3763698.1 ATP-dependent helicase/nuclease subunit A [Sphingomicrobium lutaoense]
MRSVDRLKPLTGNQEAASDPSIHAALSASAGTGKTHVLTSRVLRLLLQGVAPESILCLTFTKAAAAEMSNRIGARLASWVRLKEDQLRSDLRALGEPASPDMIARARRLFARVLDAPGGLKIQTLHSFAQGLLGAFPAEAGISPGFEAMDDRQQKALAREVLAELASDAEEAGDRQFLSDLSALSRRLGEEGALKYLARCGEYGPSLARLPAEPLIEPALRELMELPEGDVEEAIAASCSDPDFDRALVERLIAVNREWGTKSGLEIAGRLESWLLCCDADRAGRLPLMAKGVVTQDGRPHFRQKDKEAAQALADRVGELQGLRARAELAAVQAAGLRAGARFARAYGDAKQAEGLADFDDLIRWSNMLLAQDGIGDWVRFKLDQRIDHILVDEAQDTNADQWFIVAKLTEEFFSGSPEEEGRFRTAFLVGDFKQAIYRFQGAEPEQFVRMSSRFAEAARQQREAWQESGEGTAPRSFEELTISTSYRSAQAILDVVNAFILGKTPEALGLDRAPPPHESHDPTLKGRVELWPPFAVEEEFEEEGEEDWNPERDRMFASKLAREVKALIEGPDDVEAGDVLILLRSRQLAPLIIARLYGEGVPVAGVDRLLLSQPLAVRDLIAAMRFASQPLDDLNLACLLVSPLFGWDHEALHRLAFGRKGALWDALRGRRDEDAQFAEAFAGLSGLLAMADYAGPAAFLETILSGPIGGRAKLVARLGEEAGDPIDELMNVALQFEQEEGASLDRFLGWFEQGDVDVKREAAEAGDSVRIMTVHGAKGLEAPVVILADATGDYSKLGDPSSRNIMLFELGSIGKVPMVKPRSDQLVEPFATTMEAMADREREEHMRLLYVAMTRAARRLIVTGTAPARGKLHKDCWWLAVEQAMQDAGAVPLDAPWGERGWVHESGSGRRARAKRSLASDEIVTPDWLHQAAPPEAQPPRPLAPSASEEGEEESFPPPGPAAREAARRGSLLHALFERLPPVEPSHRRQVALDWLASSGGVADEAAREEIVEAALRIIEDSEFAEIFGPGALAEAPIAAVLPDKRVIAGTVDRLLVEEERVLVVDFKTGRMVPEDPGAVPDYHRRQMQAYAAALQVIFPGRTVEAALLYTAGPRLVTLAG